LLATETLNPSCAMTASILFPRVSERQWRSSFGPDDKCHPDLYITVTTAQPH
jgi:hypothetical protein